MKNIIARKIICLVVASLFFINDIAWGLSTMPGSTQSDTRAAMSAMGERRFLDRNGMGIIDFEHMNLKAPEIEGVKFVKVDPDKAPEGWDNNPIYKVTDIVEAFEYFRDNEACLSKDKVKVSIISDEKWKEIGGKGNLKEEEGTVAAVRVAAYDNGTYTIVIHEKFAKIWEDLRKNDVWFTYDFPNPENPASPIKRTVSVAWGIFYRIAKHEMTDLVKEEFIEGNIVPKGGVLGHLFSTNDFGVFPTKDEVTTNFIKGRYALVNNAAMLWFLGSYLLGDDRIQRNNINLENRLNWFFGQYGTPEEKAYVINELKMQEEFPDLYIDANAREDAIDLALAINTAYYTKRLARLTKSGSAVQAEPERAQEVRTDGIREVFSSTGKESARRDGLKYSATLSGAGKKAEVTDTATGAKVEPFKGLNVKSFYQSPGYLAALTDEKFFHIFNLKTGALVTPKTWDGTVLDFPDINDPLSNDWLFQRIDIEEVAMSGEYLGFIVTRYVVTRSGERDKAPLAVICDLESGLVIKRCDFNKRHKEDKQNKIEIYGTRFTRTMSPKRPGTWSTETYQEGIDFAEEAGVFETARPIRDEILSATKRKRMSADEHFGAVLEILKESDPGLAAALEKLSHLKGEISVKKIAENIGGLKLPDIKKELLRLAFRVTREKMVYGILREEIIDIWGKEKGKPMIAASFSSSSAAAVDKTKWGGRDNVEIDQYLDEEKPFFTAAVAIFLKLKGLNEDEIRSAIKFVLGKVASKSVTVGETRSGYKTYKDIYNFDAALKLLENPEEIMAYIAAQREKAAPKFGEKHTRGSGIPKGKMEIRPLPPGAKPEAAQTRERKQQANVKDILRILLSAFNHASRIDLSALINGGRLDDTIRRIARRKLRPLNEIHMKDFFFRKAKYHEIKTIEDLRKEIELYFSKRGVGNIQSTSKIVPGAAPKDAKPEMSESAVVKTLSYKCNLAKGVLTVCNQYGKEVLKKKDVDWYKLAFDGEHIIWGEYFPPVVLSGSYFPETKRLYIYNLRTQKYALQQMDYRNARLSSDGKHLVWADVYWGNTVNPTRCEEFSVYDFDIRKLVIERAAGELNNHESFGSPGGYTDGRYIAGNMSGRIFVYDLKKHCFALNEKKPNDIIWNSKFSPTQHRITWRTGSGATLSYVYDRTTNRFVLATKGREQRTKGSKDIARRADAKKPGKSPKDAMTVIALTLELQSGPFTLEEYLDAYKKVCIEHPELGFEYLAANPESTARRDLYLLPNSLEKMELLTVAGRDEGGKPYTFELTAAGRKLADAKAALAMAAPKREKLAESRLREESNRYFSEIFKRYQPAAPIIDDIDSYRIEKQVEDGDNVFFTVTAKDGTITTFWRRTSLGHETFTRGDIEKRRQNIVSRTDRLEEMLYQAGFDIDKKLHTAHRWISRIAYAGDGYANENDGMRRIDLDITIDIKNLSITVENNLDRNRADWVVRFGEDATYFKSGQKGANIPFSLHDIGMYADGSGIVLETSESLSRYGEIYRSFGNYTETASGFSVEFSSAPIFEKEGKWQKDTVWLCGDKNPDAVTGRLAAPVSGRKLYVQAEGVAKNYIDFMKRYGNRKSGMMEKLAGKFEIYELANERYLVIEPDNGPAGIYYKDKEAYDHWTYDLLEEHCAADSPYRPAPIKSAGVFKAKVSKNVVTITELSTGEQVNPFARLDIVEFKATEYYVVGRSKDCDIYIFNLRNGALYKPTKGRDPVEKFSREKFGERGSGVFSRWTFEGMHLYEKSGVLAVWQKHERSNETDKRYFSLFDLESGEFLIEHCERTAFDDKYDVEGTTMLLHFAERPTASGWIQAGINPAAIYDYPFAAELSMARSKNPTAEIAWRTEESDPGMGSATATKDAAGKFKSRSGKNPNDAMTVIALTPELQSGPFTLEEYLDAYKKVCIEHPELGFEYLAANPESTARRDLYLLPNSLEKMELLTVAGRDEGGKPYTFELTAAGRKLADAKVALAMAAPKKPAAAIVPADGRGKIHFAEETMGALQAMLDSPEIMDALSIDETLEGYFTIDDAKKAWQNMWQEEEIIDRLNLLVDAELLEEPTYRYLNDTGILRSGEDRYSKFFILTEAGKRELNNMSKSQPKPAATQEEHELISILSEYILRPGSGVTPGLKLTENMETLIHETVNLLDDNEIEIFSGLILTDTMEKALRGMKKGMGHVSYERYGSLKSVENLKKALEASAGNGKKKIVIVNSKDAALVEALKSDTKLQELLIGVRLMSVTLPDNYLMGASGERMGDKDRVIYEAKVITRAILLRLYDEKLNVVAKDVLMELMKADFEDGTSVAKYLESIVESENEDLPKAAQRIKLSLEMIVSLIKIKGQELMMMKELWRYA